MLQHSTLRPSAGSGAVLARSRGGGSAVDRVVRKAPTRRLGYGGSGTGTQTRRLGYGGSGESRADGAAATLAAAAPGSSPLLRERGRETEIEREREEGERLPTPHRSPLRYRDPRHSARPSLPMRTPADARKAIYRCIDI
jgi:hypothetical protein